MKKMSLGVAGFERKTKRTRQCEFLDEVNLVLPWTELVTLVAFVIQKIMHNASPHWIDQKGQMR